MNWVDNSTHSFIVKIWLEETAEQSGKAKWRGCVTHVRSGERRYVESLSGIADFLAGYLDAMGLDLGLRWRFEKWILRWKESRGHRNG